MPQGTLPARAIVRVLLTLSLGVAVALSSLSPASAAIGSPTSVSPALTSPPAAPTQASTAKRAPAPSASYTYSPANPTTGTRVTFDGSSSTCAATPCTYHWHDVGPSGTDDYALGDGKTIDFTFQYPGTKYVQLVVTDAHGRYDSATQAISVTSNATPTPTPTPTATSTPTPTPTATPSPTPTPVAPPSAAYTYSPAAPQTGQSVTFDASGSTCAATPCSYHWHDVGSSGTDDYPLGDGQTLSFTFQSVGTKYVQLVVTDAQGRYDSATQAITVTSATATPTPTPTPTPTATSTPTPTPTPSPSPTPTSSGSCDLNATPSNFASQVSAAAAGQTICLASGDYGTFQGTNKQITIRAADGATPTMRYSFTTGDSGFTLDGMNNMGGSITNGAHDITIRNSHFNSYATFDGLANSNIVFDHNTHINISSPSGSPNARLGFYWGSNTPSGVTIENSLMQGGDSDGVHTGVAVNVLNNTFLDLCDAGGNHTDNIQFEGAVGGHIAGNYIHATCTTQGITSYDGGTNGVLIEDNVVDIRRAWGIEFYSDNGSIIRHNTVRYYAPGCYDSSPCGLIDIDRKSTDPAGTGTQVYDNIANVTVNNGSTTSRNDHNLNNSNVTYVGPTTSWTGYKLTATSAGTNAADDGTNLGARIP